MVHRLNIFYIALIGMLIRHSTSYSVSTKRLSYTILKLFDDKSVGSDSAGNRRPISAYAKHFGRRQAEGSSRQPAYGHFEGDHIYGVNPVLLAIKSGRRKITELLVQSGLEVADKTLDSGSSEILRLCSDAGIDVKSFSKHDLNMLTENRPHQGFVLRASPLKFEKTYSLPPSSSFKCFLALDEVWDPQNFGALLRTCFFLGVDGVVVCSKNSAPLSPAVSKASAGAMEVMTVNSVENMMNFLDKSTENGWQVVGTALDDSAIGIHELPLTSPTILVLGNEGHGIRTNVLRRCTSLVKIASGSGSGSEPKGDVDSLNVSVTGGILLHHIMQAKRSQVVKLA